MDTLRLLRLAAIACAACAWACRGPLVFPCSDDSVCVRSGAGNGRCTTSAAAASRYCAFSDITCAAGLRFDPTAGEGLAGACVGEGPGSDGGTPLHVHWRNLDGMTNDDFWGVGGYDAQHVWAVGVPGIYFSSDGGRTWKPQKTPMSAIDLAAVWARPGNAWVVGWNGIILHSINEGQTWNLQISPIVNEFSAIWGTDPHNLYISGYAGTVLHTNDGVKWVQQDASAGGLGDLNGIWGSARNDVYIVGQSGTILHSINDGADWKPVASGTTLTLFGIWGSGPQDIYAVGDQEIILHKDASPGFSTLMKPLDTMTTHHAAVWGSGPTDVYVVGSAGSIIHSSDGQSWQPQMNGASTLLNGVWGDSDTDVFAVGNSGTLLHGTPE